MGIFNLEAFLTLDSSKYDKGLQDAQSKATSIGGSIGNGLLSIGKGVATAVGAATTAVGAFAASAVQVGSSFDSSMSQVKATMGNVDDMTEESFDKIKASAKEMGIAFDESTSATELSFQVLRQYAQDMGATTAFSATQASEALNYMALAGYDATTSMEMLPNVLNLAAAGGMELANASDMITDTQSALGLTVEETTELVDKMAKASSKSNTSVEQLGSAMLTIGGTAKSLTGGTTELATALGILADNGTKGAEGGTALRNVLLGLESSKFKENFGELGISAYDAQGNLRSLKDVFADMSMAMSEFTQEERDEIITKTFNKNDLKNVNALLATTTDRWDELSGAIDNSKGSAEEMAHTQLDNLNGSITLFKSALEGTQILISDQLTPDLKEFVDFGTEGLTKISEGFKSGGLTGAMDAFGTVLSEGLSMIISKLPSMIDAGMKLLEALGKGILDNLPILIDATLQVGNQLLTGIVQALPYVAEGALQIISGLANGLAQALPTLIPTVVEVIGQIVQAIIENIPLLVEAGVNILTGLQQGILNAVPVLIEMAPTLIQSLVNAIVTGIPLLIQGTIQLVQGIVTALPTIIQSLINALPQIINSLVNGLMTSLPLLIQGNIQLVLGLVRAMPQIIKALTNAIPQIIKIYVDALVNNLPQIINGLIMLVGMIVEALPEVVMALIQAVPQIVTSIVQAIVTSAPLIIGAVVQILATVGTTLIQKGADFVRNVGQTMSDILNKVVEWLSQLPEKMAYWAGYSIMSFMLFIAELPGKVKTEFDNTIANLANFATEFWNKAKETGREFVNKIMEDIKELPGKIKEIGENMLEAIKDLPENFKSVGSDIVNGLMDGIKEKWEGLKEWFLGLVGGLLSGAKDKLAEKSPSKKFKEVGEFIDEGLQIGIENKFPQVRKTVEELVDIVQIPDQETNFAFTGSADEINGRYANISKEEETGEPYFVSNMVDAFVKALDKYGLMVEVDHRELGRVVRREVLA